MYHQQEDLGTISCLKKDGVYVLQVLVVPATRAPATSAGPRRTGSQALAVLGHTGLPGVANSSTPASVAGVPGQPYGPNRAAGVGRPGSAAETSP